MNQHMKMIRTILFSIAIAVFIPVITALFLTACGQEEDKSYASKAHTDEHLVQKEYYVFEDGSSVDYYDYEQIDGYFFLSGTEELLLQMEPVPEIWEYEECIDAMSEAARKNLQKTVETLPLYDLDHLLDQAYKDYCSCRDSENSEDVFEHHVIFIDADVSIDADVLTCCFQISYAPDGHFYGELAGKEYSCSFCTDTGELIE